MPVPTLITDLSTVAASNSPDGASESPKLGDDYIRTYGAFIAQIRDMLNGTSNSGTIKNPVFSGTSTGTITIAGATLPSPTISGAPVISSAAVTWSGNPTHSGTHTWSGLQTNSVGAKFGNADQADPSTLDWVRKATTFSPVVLFGGAAATGWVFSTLAGVYWRTGNLVHIKISIVVSTVGSATGQFSISVGALPFTPASLSGIDFIGDANINTAASTSGVPACLINSASGVLLHTTANSTGGRIFADNTLFQAGTKVHLQASYYV